MSQDKFSLEWSSRWAGGVVKSKMSFDNRDNRKNLKDLWRSLGLYLPVFQRLGEGVTAMKRWM